ncbi:DUF5304 family protein [Streptomyces gobiensis]|uniref:DUF5304 family protein n=1 Tax=Streptomyces gobiensis TaxID=2875706 RepID=UPI001E59AEF2|nr:DUF5304 family protein [Streptomyces gobiensis]UGY90916.1 DUF5304 domain-containing protein [Streptomyces gobiensis]
MSDATEPEADAWAAACAEDLAAEQARRREQYGAPPGSAGEELRKLVDTVAEKLADIAGPLTGAAGKAAGQAAAENAEKLARQLAEDAKSVAQPFVERNPEVFGHLAAAGSELLAAYRAAVEGHEQRWTKDEARRAPEPREPRDQGDDGDGPSGSERIDLD